MNSSQTPRTDAEICKCKDGYSWIKPSFARQLELENNRLQARVKELKETVSACVERIKQEERAASGCRFAANEAERHCKRISAERDSLKQQ